MLLPSIRLSTFGNDLLNITGPVACQPPIRFEPVRLNQEKCCEEVLRLFAFFDTPRAIVLSLLITVLFRPGIVQAEQAPSSRETERTRLQSEAVMCGPNAVYSLLRIMGRTPSPDLIERLRPTRAEGMSLAEIRVAADEEGLQLELLKWSVDELCRNFRSPLIAYTRSWTGQEGHFLIVYKVKDDHILLMDPTTCEIVRTNKEKLRNIWREYVAVPRNDSLALSTSYTLILSGSAWVALWAATAFRFRHRATAEAQRASS